MPFRLQNAGQSFQHFMDRVLAGLDYCFVYVDDVLIGSKSHEGARAASQGGAEQAG